MIGIIGFGRFGRLMAGYLARDFDIYVFNRSNKAADILALGAHPASFATACRQKIVVLCVPISSMEATLREVAPLLQENALVVDVCSVKVFPVQWMKTILPDTVSILATHPMFGPDSAANSLNGRKIVLCDTRIEAACYGQVAAYLAAKGLIVIQASPEEHDQKIAVSLFLTHFIGRALESFGAQPMNIDTEGYQRLLHILGVVENDTWQLFQDMYRYNPYAKERRDKFLAAMEGINAKLER
jgi:prephenate dehydrogenase